MNRKRQTSISRQQVISKEMEEKKEETLTSSVGPSPSYFYEDEVFRINKNGEVE